MEKQSNISNAGFLRWMKPVLTALRNLGGQGTRKEVYSTIAKNEHLTEKELSEKRGKNNVNKFENEVAFAREYLAASGYIDRSIRGVWKLTEQGWSVDMTDDLASDIVRKIRVENRNKKDGNVIRGNEKSTFDSNEKEISYWIYSPGDNACMWEEFSKQNIMGIGWDEIGDLNQYSSKEELKEQMKDTYNASLSYRNVVHGLWQFANEMKIGDVVFAKKGIHKIVGRGIVTSDYFYDESRSSYQQIRKVEWQSIGLWDHPGNAVMKALTNITPYSDYVQSLLELFAEESEVENIQETEIRYVPYNKEDFLNEVYMNSETYDTLVNLLEIKYNIILQGAPGVGKTYVAKRLAYSIMGEMDTSRVTMVQFHQSYSYEDFIQGYRPTETGFKLSQGSFYKFCKKAEEDDERLYFFIIDEINRGNLSKIFGELMMLIEKDKRGQKVKLLYKDEWFTVPKNVRIIGMMNTADRSLAMMDYALRRRFAFFDFAPAFSSEGFKQYLSEKNNKKLHRLISVIENLNDTISNDESLGDGFRIGHSYFCTGEEITDEWLNSVVEYEIIPLLKEYWFDEPTKIRNWSSNLRGAIK